jgi:LL-diaminopimelate aminotransferase
MMIASKKTQQMSTSIFTELANKKREAIGRGIDVIDLSVGSPDMPPPEHVVDALVTYSKDTTKYGYTLKGIDEFHEAVGYFYKQRYGIDLNPENEVLQLMGSQDGLSHLATAMIDPGDYVLVPDPGYPIYEHSVVIAGGTIYPMPLVEENGYLPKLNEIPFEVLEKTK